MISTMLRKGNSLSKPDVGVDALLTVNEALSDQTNPKPLDQGQSQPKIGMVMDASDVSWGLIPSKTFLCRDGNYFESNFRKLEDGEGFSFLVGGETPRFAYSRPEFLFLTTDDELGVSADQTTRPVLVPKDPQKMTMLAGYAETINAGKTDLNEDQAFCKVMKISCTKSDSRSEKSKLESKWLKLNRKRTKSVEPNPISPGNGTSLGRRLSDEDLLLMNSNLFSDKAKHCEINGRENTDEIQRVEANYFAIFDGHAGTGAALMAYNCLHEHIRERLACVLNTILELDDKESSCSMVKLRHNDKKLNSSVVDHDVTKDSLIVGALENAFLDMDEQIHDEKILWRISGGAAAIAALFFMGKLYIANAGDCRYKAASIFSIFSIFGNFRAIICTTPSNVKQLTTDFTPDFERKRLQFLAHRQPELLNKSFSRLEYDRFLARKDLNSKVFVRDWYMDGWCQKTVRESDLRPPMINQNHRKCRLLNTIGVTRGFGDHHLITVDENLSIKPFLSAVPQVVTFDLTSLNDLTEKDVLIMASDGLWDVMTNEEAADIVRASFTSQISGPDWTRYTLAAQDLVIAARGQPYKEGKRWKGLEEGGKASTDDITVFVIPLKFALNYTLDDDDDVDLLQ